MDLTCPSLLMDNLKLEETSDYGSRETSADDSISGVCQVEFRGNTFCILHLLILYNILERLVISRGSHLYLKTDGVESM